jgi:hypothetical protein
VVSESAVAQDMRDDFVYRAAACTDAHFARVSPVVLVVYV